MTAILIVLLLGADSKPTAAELTDELASSQEQLKLAEAGRVLRRTNRKTPCISENRLGERTMVFGSSRQQKSTIEELTKRITELKERIPALEEAERFKKEGKPVGLDCFVSWPIGHWGRYITLNRWTNYGIEFQITNKSGRTLKNLKVRAKLISGNQKKLLDDVESRISELEPGDTKIVRMSSKYNGGTEWQISVEEE